MIWAMLLQLVTGQVIGFDMPSEAECRDTLAQLAAGRGMVVTLTNGVRTVEIPVAKGIDCVLRRPKEAGT